MAELWKDGQPSWSFAQGMGQNIMPFSLNDPFTLILCLVGPSFVAKGMVYTEVVKIILAGFFFARAPAFFCPNDKKSLEDKKYTD